MTIVIVKMFDKINNDGSIGAEGLLIKMWWVDNSICVISTTVASVSICLLQFSRIENVCRSTTPKVEKRFKKKNFVFFLNSNKFN